VTAKELNRKLDEARTDFRARVEALGVKRVWENFRGRIGLVLSGGGGRGAYQAGVLLAFQDAGVPTHIVTGASIGSMNAAGYVGTSSTLVGNAEPVAAAWLTFKEHDLGIKWTRWTWMLVGLLAASSGFGNLVWYAAQQRGIRFNVPHPGLTWLALGCAGISALFTSDRLPYFGHLLANRLRGRPSQFDPRKAAVSIAGNLVFWLAIAVVLHSLLAGFDLGVFIANHRRPLGAGIAALLVSFVLRKHWVPDVGVLAQRVLGLALHPGLFTNFERARLLRDGVTNQQLSASPIRLVITAVDMESGSPRFFSNTPPATLILDPGADVSFIHREIVNTDDLICAAVASSALPIAFEPIRIAGRVYGDGGLCANEPIRPAVALGADVVFLVMMSTPGSTRHKLGTFVDVGLSALDILTQQTLKHDMEMVSTMNSVCEQAAASYSLRPEEVEIALGSRRFRHINCFAICPPEPLAGSTLECNPRVAAPNMLRGYLDAQAQILNFVEDAREARYGHARRVLTWTAEKI
jgi:predicted acylesterase/phospholipase RssA